MTDSSDSPSYSDRGFAGFDPIVSSYGEKVQVYESSSADSPHVWVRVSGGLDAANLTLDQARQLRDQLDWFLSNHYQLEGVDRG